MIKQLILISILLFGGGMLLVGIALYFYGELEANSGAATLEENMK